MRPDTFTNTPEDAAAYEQIRGQDEAIDPGGFVETRTPFCRLCQNASRSTYVCGPCERQWPVVWTCRACGIDHRFDDDDRCECGRLREDRSA